LDYLEWEPHYRRIVREFGFSIDDDGRSAQTLARICSKKDVCPPECLRRMVGEEVTILGDGPNLEQELRQQALKGTLVVADGATSTLMHALGRIPDIIVTDLDGDVVDQIAANAQGAIVVVLAHGDNEALVRRYVPWFTGPITPTTQGRPFDGVYNFGGFTDGDRAVLLARHMGATRIHLRGFDLTNPRPKVGKDRAIKLRKLEIARELIWDLNPSDVVIDQL
jgi:2-amino-4-hydroxy-6-hydroxymethyldihydropteridine diphosphokinase